MCFNIILLVTLIVACQAAAAQPDAVFQRYLEALIARDTITAQSCWTSELIAASERLEIIYTDIEAKYDGASPIVSHLKGIRKGKIAVKPLETRITNDNAELPVDLISGRDSISTTYYFTKSGSQWYITSPLFTNSLNWKSITTRFTEIHYNDPSLLNEYAITELDRFIDHLGRQFDILNKDIEQLSKEKLDYYLCNEMEFERLTGHKAQGMTNLQFDAVVTRHLPHYHELVHFMINFALRELPLYTLPFLQEGLACTYGGRWNKSPEIILYMGYHNLALELAKLDDILTYTGFFTKVGMPDITYPISTQFVKLIIDKRGFDKFLDLYSNLSGPSQVVVSFLINDIQKAAEKVFQQSWTEIAEDYKKEWQQYRYCGIMPGHSSVESSDNNNKRKIISKESNNLSIKISEHKDGYNFKAHLPTNNNSGFLLLMDSSLPVKDTYRSSLFAEHLSEITYTGERFAIQFSRDDAGFYDYYDNRLIAKFVGGFTPSDEYWNEEDKTVTFWMEKGVSKRNLFDLGMRLVGE